MAILSTNKVKEILRDGGIAIGTMVFGFNVPAVSQIAAQSGADFIVFDLEHTGWGFDSIQAPLTIARCLGVTPIVRVPTLSYSMIARALDIGALGLMIPMVETPEQARQIINFSKYPPIGRRGAAFGIAHDGYDTTKTASQKIKEANSETLIIAQIETKVGLENVEDIAAEEGIDVLWIGHFDLTNSMGIPGQFAHPEYLSAVARILEACHKNDKAAGFMVAGTDEARDKLAAGFRCLGYWGDIWLYGQALHTGIKAVREIAVGKGTAVRR